MSFIPNQESRRLLPRWRSFSEAARLGELDSSSRKSPAMKSSEPEPHLLEKIVEWDREANVGLAVDILSSAVVLGRAREFERIGWWILAQKNEFAPAVIGLAEACVHDTHLRPIHSSRVREEVVNILRRCREMASDNPKDAILYVDTALAHTILGNADHAAKAIKIATALAPENRFVLRSAARFWVHVGDLQRAHDLLTRNARTKFDPWLLAAELSVSSIANKSPRFMNEARIFLNNRGAHPRQISELAGALGTLEALDGRSARARSHFNQSLTAPTENAVAQAVWASQSARILPEVSLGGFRHLRLNEASAWQARSSLQWEAAISHCMGWLDDEPFSHIPATFGSFAASLIEDHEKSLEFAQIGLDANPRNFTLRNNLLVAQIFLNKEIDVNALIVLANLVHTAAERAVFLATSGLVLLRDGELISGREMYKTAIDTALQCGDKKTAALAAAFWARVELSNVKNGDALMPTQIFLTQAKSLRDPEVVYFRKYFRSRTNLADGIEAP